jgi:hypothetical protein
MELGVLHLFLVDPVDLLELGVFGWKNLEQSWFFNLELSAALPNTHLSNSNSSPSQVVIVIFLAKTEKNLLL